MGHPEERPDDARKISIIWEGADDCCTDTPSTLDKVTSIGDILLQVLRVVGVFQGSILRDTARTQSISGSVIALNNAYTRSILGFDTLIYTVLRVFWGSLLLRNTRCT